MIKGGHDEGEEDRQAVTDQDVIVQDGHRNVAILTPEQVEGAEKKR